MSTLRACAVVVIQEPFVPSPEPIVSAPLGRIISGRSGISSMTKNTSGRKSATAHLYAKGDERPKGERAWACIEGPASKGARSVMKGREVYTAPENGVPDREVYTAPWMVSEGQTVQRMDRYGRSLIFWFFIDL